MSNAIDRDFMIYEIVQSLVTLKNREGLAAVTETINDMRGTLLREVLESAILQLWDRQKQLKAIEAKAEAKAAKKRAAK